MLNYNLINVGELRATLSKQLQELAEKHEQGASSVYSDVGRCDSWDGDIDSLPVKHSTKSLIKDGAPVGKRSEAMMTVLCALVTSELSDPEIIDIFEEYAIGEKCREKGPNREQWLLPQIEKARKLVSGTSLEVVISQVNELFKDGALNHHKWSRIVFDAMLTPAETDEVIEHLVKIGVGKKRTLDNEWKHRKKELDEQTLRQLKTDELSIAAAGKHVIEWDATDLNKMVKETENGLLSVKGEWPVLNHGGCLSLVTVERPASSHAIDMPNEAPPMVAIMKRYDRNSLFLRIEQSNCYTRETKTGPEQIPVPNTLPSFLLDHPSSKASDVNGLVSHPIVTSSGDYVNKEGYDEQSKLYLDYGGKKFGDLMSGGQSEAHDLFEEIVDGLFSEFEWEDAQLDKAVAVIILLTTLLRKLFDMAPGFFVTANIQGSGKTTIFRIIYIVVTGYDMPASTLSEEKEELRKAMLAMLMESVPLICFDNVPDGFEIRSSILAMVLTSPYFKERLLGVSKQIQAPTNTVIGITGNNLSMDSDLVRRFIPLRLQPKGMRPEKRQFKNPDIVPWARSIRTDMIIKALSIVKIYIDSGSPDVLGKKNSSGFPMWDKRVRSPILWASGVDVMDAVDNARNESSDLMAKHAAIDALVRFFGYEKEFTASKVFEKIKREGAYYRDNANDWKHLQEAFLSLSPKTVWNNASTGWALKKLLNFPSNRGTLKRRAVNNVHRYMMVEP